MFTFSFGSAFAADAKTTAEANINQAAVELKASLDTAYNSAVARITATTTVTAPVKGVYATAGAEALKKAAADLYADEVFKIELARQILLAGVSDANAANYATVEAAKGYFDGNAVTVKEEKTASGWATIALGATVELYKNGVYTANDWADYVLTAGTYVNGYDTMFISYALPEAAAKVEAAIAAVELAQYGSEVICEDDPYETTYAEAAAAKVAAMLANVEDLNDVTADKATMVLAWKALNGMIANELTVASYYDKSEAKVVVGSGAEAEDTVYSYVLNATWDDCGKHTHAIKVDASLAADDAQTAVDVAKALADANAANADAYKNCYDYAQAYLSATTTPTKADYLAMVKERFEAANEVNAWRAANDITTMIEIDTDKATDASGELAVGIVEAVAAAKADAATLKAAVDKTGELRWDAAKIDEELEDKIEALYTAADAAALATAKAIDLTAYDTEHLDFVKACYVDDLQDALKAELYTNLGVAKYYDEEAAEITAIYEEAIAKVEAAATEAQAAKAKASLNTVKISKVDKKAGVQADIKALKNFAAEKGAVDAYATYLATGISSISGNYVNYSALLTADTLADFYAKNGARTAEEIAALHDAALEWVAGFETKAEIEAAADAVEAQIAALPKASALTLADKDAVAAAEAAYRALNAAEKAQVYNYGTLEALKAATQNKEAAEIAKAIKAIPAKVTVADKAAIEAAQAMVDAYEEDVLYYNYTAGTYADYNTVGTLDQDWADLRAAEDKAVEAEIAALGVDPSVAAVKAARDAYEAYVEYWTSYEDGGYYAADDINNLSTLVYAEKKIGAKVIYDVRALKITAGSTAKKGSITVKWTVEGNEDAADYYVIAKSTKKNSGFKKVFETEKMSYKNTKGLKKGTRYYYKVKAVAVVDGVEYTSDWSNKAYRVAK